MVGQHLRRGATAALARIQPAAGCGSALG
jgi:hypothetical protein